MVRRIRQLLSRPRDIPFIAAMLAVFLLVPATVLTVLAQTAPRITAGPTVPQSGITETTATVTWSTDIPSTTVVEFGTTQALGQLYNKIVPLEETEVTETSHSMTLWSLSSGTQYFYKVRSVSEAGGSVESGISSFTTAAPAFTGTPLRGASIASPASGTVSADGVVNARVRIDGKADKVSVSFAPVAGGGSKQADASSAGDDWMAPPVTLETGEWTIVATAEGLSATGAPTSVTSGPVSVIVIAPPAEEEPEPSAEEEEVVLEPVQPVEPEFPVAKEGESEPEIGPAAEPPAAEDGTKEPEPAAEPEIGEEPEGSEIETSMGVMTRTVMAPAEGKRAFEVEYESEQLDGAEAPAAQRLTVVMRSYGEGVEEAVSQQLFESVDEFMAVAVGTVDEEGVIEVGPEVEDSADAVIERAVEENVFVSLPGGLSAVSDVAAEGARWWPSVKEEGVPPAMAVLDADHDGLPDDYEVANGMDPTLADTDGDGASDIAELQRGDDPAGEGALERELDPTERTVVFQRALAQPSSDDDVDEDFEVLADRAGANAVGTGVISGRCDPSVTCILYVYSYIPMVLTTTTAADGSWQYDLADSVVGGEHTVYVAVTDDTGKIERRSNPLSFFVPEARAITVDEALAATAAQVTGIAAGTPEDVQQRYLYGVILVIVLAIAAAAGLLLRPTGKKGKGEGGTE